jgi:hypothetical protein
MNKNIIFSIVSLFYVLVSIALLVYILYSGLGIGTFSMTLFGLIFVALSIVMIVSIVISIISIWKYSRYDC